MSPRGAILNTVGVPCVELSVNSFFKPSASYPTPVGVFWGLAMTAWSMKVEGNLSVISPQLVDMDWE